MVSETMRRLLRIELPYVGNWRDVLTKEFTWCLYAMFSVAVGSVGVGCTIPADADDGTAPAGEIQPATGCPYQTLQARVQPNIQTPWNQLQSIPLGQTVHMAGFGMRDHRGRWLWMSRGRPAIALNTTRSSTRAIGTETLPYRVAARAARASCSKRVQPRDRSRSTSVG